MNKKGFTLTEILGVIIILSFLVFMIVPSVSKVISNNKKKLYEVQIGTIEKAAKDYTVKNADKLPDEGDVFIVTLGELKKNGFIQVEVRNPITKELFSDELQIEIKKENNQYIYTVLDEVE